jgi:thioredoxin-related protein
MKNILVVIFLLNSTYLFSQGINFFQGNFEELKKEASKQKKFIFVDCYTSWCGPCKWLAKNVFTNKNVAKFYNENFINYSIDMEKGDGKEFAKKYKISAYPTLLFLDYKGNIQHRFVGACDTITFLSIGKQALDTNNNFGSLLRKYNDGNRDPQFLAKYALNCISVYYPYDINEYLNTQKDEDLLSEINIQIIERYSPPVESREIIYIAKNFSQFANKFGFERIYSLLTNSMNKHLTGLMNTVKNFYPESIVENYIFRNKISNGEFWKAAFLTEFNIYYKVKNYEGFLIYSKSFLMESEKIPQYFLNCFTLLVESFKNKINEPQYNKQFIDIIQPYEKKLENIISFETLISLCEISLKANDKIYFNQLVSIASNKALNNSQKEELNKLLNKANNQNK